MKRIGQLVYVLVGCLFALSQTVAEQRALLVGVGEYQLDGLDLPGIDLDLDRVTDMLKVMGFDESQIKRLENQDATAANVLEHFDTWLTDGVGEDDRVVLYYSGHGSFIPDLNGDEPDGVDEVLVTHDVRYRSVNGRRSLDGVVTDDQISAMIQGTGSNNVLVIVDACHSGTMTRDILLDNKSLTGEPVFEKVFVWEDMPVGDDAGMTRDISASKSRAERALERKFVGISAAGDGEKAIGTSRGGMFTIGFTNAIMNSAQAGSVVTIEEARDQAERFIRQKIEESRVHTPVVTGSEELANGSLEIVPINGDGPIWTRLVEATGQGQFFEMTPARPEFAVGEVFEATLEIPEAGYLNLVSVDAKDNASVVFPNSLQSENYVEAGSFVFPKDAVGFDLAAAAPAGPTLLVAFLSKRPLNLRELGYEGRLASGEFSEDSTFTEISYSATRALTVIAKIEPAAGEEEGGSAIAAAAGATAAIAIDAATEVAGEMAGAAAGQVGEAVDAAGDMAGAAGAAVSAVAEMASGDDDESAEPAEAVAEAEVETEEAGDQEAVDAEPAPPEPTLYASSLEIMVVQPPKK